MYNYVHFCVIFRKKLDSTRVCKYFRSESKSAVMDVIVFLCVSLGSSTIQLDEILGSRRACACSNAGYSKWRTCLRTILQKSIILLWVFLLSKGLNGKDIHKETFRV
jgi:hypothetical protein